MKRLLAGLLALALPAVGATAPAAGPAGRPLDAAAAARFAALALECVHREYPNKIAHVMQSDADARPPRALTPAFYGCYDWHSSVHGHWLLARLVKSFPDAEFSATARAALARSLTPANIAVEVEYLRGSGRASFERPYGLAWLLQLAAELRTWDDPQAREWAKALSPLEIESAQRIMGWLPRLNYPIRSGEHSQTAFAFGLIWDWAAATGDVGMIRLLDHRGRTYYAKDRGCALAYEPSGEDFLSPCVAEADFMRRVLPRDEFAAWLQDFLPAIPLDGTRGLADAGRRHGSQRPEARTHRRLEPEPRVDARGYRERPAARRSSRRGSARCGARAHAQAALPAVTGEHYEGGHWLGTFAVYLTTGAGLRR